MVCGVFLGILRVFFCNKELSENGCGRFNLQSVQAELNSQGSSKKNCPLMAVSKEFCGVPVVGRESTRSWKRIMLTGSQ